MKPKFSAYTLVESLFVLGITAILLTLALSFQLRPPGQTVSGFENQFTAVFQKQRLQSQNTGKDVQLEFTKHRLVVDQESVPYPAGYSAQTEKIVVIKASGYVAPGHIIFEKGKEILKLIFQFGGGSYRFEKE
ncbi:type II secretion system protein [Fructobacillus ficulneus]|uniref:Competence protein ComGD n=1 Tax=Fructobacillus ficulneus TaxID=157463 RepID=A0A0K8MG92_9LACO|nr:type II secretion system protein [Fructobacillus ficulneus]GAO99566.1 hypothetical protein FFIC_230500 [Fructobacillus ficulneus]